MQTLHGAERRQPVRHGRRDIEQYSVDLRDAVIEGRPERLLSGMRHDKKGSAGEPRFVLPIAAGRLARDVAVERKLLEVLLARS